VIEIEVQRRKRAAIVSVADARQAREAVREIREKIGAWQSEASRLRMQYVYAANLQEKSAVSEQAATLLAVVRPALASLDGLSRALPRHIAGNSHFQDVVRALQSVIAALETFASGAL